VRKAEEIRENIRISCLMDEVDPVRKITMSIGVAMVDLSAPLELNVENADSALYRAKQQGRDRVVLAPPLSETPSIKGV
jgi:diguanylate cyclase (GGDEF)-like protein